MKAIVASRELHTPTVGMHNDVADAVAWILKAPAAIPHGASVGEKREEEVRRWFHNLAASPTYKERVFMKLVERFKTFALERTTVHDSMRELKVWFETLPKEVTSALDEEKSHRLRERLRVLSTRGATVDIYPELQPLYASLRSTRGSLGEKFSALLKQKDYMQIAVFGKVWTRLLSKPECSSLDQIAKMVDACAQVRQLQDNRVPSNAWSYIPVTETSSKAILAFIESWEACSKMQSEEIKGIEVFNHEDTKWVQEQAHETLDSVAQDKKGLAEWVKAVVEFVNGSGDLKQEELVSSLSAATQMKACRWHESKSILCTFAGAGDFDLDRICKSGDLTSRYLQSAAAGSEDD